MARECTFGSVSFLHPDIVTRLQYRFHRIAGNGEGGDAEQFHRQPGYSNQASGEKQVQYPVLYFFEMIIFHNNTL